MRIINKCALFIIMLVFIGLVSCEEETNDTKTNTTIGEYTQKHVKNVLIEDFTGTWCGYCPRVADAIDDVLESTDKVIAIAVHDDDDMGYPFVGDMITKFNIEGFPTGLVDRSYNWSYPETLEGLENSIGEKTPLGLKIETTVVNRTATITVKVEFAVDIPFNLNIVVCLTEDGIIANQANYYLDGRGNPIVNFEHKHVLRKAVTDIFGNLIPPVATKKDNVATFEYSTTISNGYNIEKCNIVAFVTKSTGKIVFNSQSVKLGENRDFQYLSK